MKKVTDYQEKQLKAIQNFYQEVCQRTNSQFSLSDVVIAWFTEGYAEVFRRRNLRNKAIATS